MIDTGTLWPASILGIVQLTVWPAVVHVPDPATAERIVSPAGTPSVKVTGAVETPPLETVKAYSDAPPAGIVAGAADPVMPASRLCSSPAATFTSMSPATSSGR